MQIAKKHYTKINVSAYFGFIICNNACKKCFHVNDSMLIVYICSIYRSVIIAFTEIIEVASEIRAIFKALLL